MDEIRFVNSFTRDKSTAKEIYGWWYYKRPVFVAFYIIMAIYLFSFILGFILSPGEMLGDLPVLFFILFGIFIFNLSYFSQVRAMVKRDAEMSGGRELLSTVTVSDSEAVVISFESRTAISLENMRYAFTTKNYIVLVTKARLMMILKKDSFTQGDTEGFISFLQSKGIKVKGKKK